MKRSSADKSEIRIDLSGQVAVVTGAGGGLGRSHALLLARRGAKVVVNDLGGNLDGTGDSTSAAQTVVEEIRAKGGQAISNSASVTDYAAVQNMIQHTMETWGRIDILVANAGILRDKSFAKMEMEDFRAIVDVHLMGAVYCAKACWNRMREQKYGRILFTTSSSGLYGNFGQANYSAAKMALVGLMQTLALEGFASNIRVNCLAPTAATRMLEGLMPPEQLERFRPEMASHGMLALVGSDAPTRTILCAGAGSFEQARITLTQGIYVGDREDAAEIVARSWLELQQIDNELTPVNGTAQGIIEAAKASSAGNPAC